MNNDQGGTLTLAYANIAVAISGDDLFRNRHRVTTRTTTDGQGNSASWSYAYTLPQANAIGTSLGDGIATSPHPNAATLYYNVFLDGDADYSDETWLVQKTWTSFLGHATVTETDPSGTTTTRSFHQGDAGCTPAVSARGSHAAITGNSCFQDMRKSEQLKGREFKTEIRSAGGILLSETLRQFDVDLLDYSHQPLTGLWRAFSYEYQVDEIAWEGGSTASTKRTETFYNGSCTLNAVDAFGNPRCIREYERGSLIRKTIHAYGVRDTATEYILDRRVATSVLDSADRYLAHRQFFYDEHTQSQGTIGSRGRLTRSIEVFDLPTPPQASITNLTLNGRDATTGYDLFGNPTEQRSYAGPGWVRWNGSAWSASTPGNGSAASLTTIAYDPTFRAFSVSTTNPLNQTQSAGYDDRMGTLTSVTDANNVTTTATYDLFGRMATLIKPGDSLSHPTVRVLYYDSEQPFRYRIDQRETAGGGNTRIRQLFYDGLGRQIQTKVEATEGSTLRNIITDTRYDGLGRVVQQSQPRLVTAADATTFEDYQAPPGSGVAWTTTAYDGLGRPSQVTAPDGSVTAHRYGVDSATALRWHDVTDPKRHRTQVHTKSGCILGI